MSLARHLALVLALLAGTSARAAPPPELDRYVERALATFGVPGASIAIVDG